MSTEEPATKGQGSPMGVESGRRPRVLPCGSRVCVNCHKGCGVVMAAYLRGLDDPFDVAGED